MGQRKREQEKAQQIIARRLPDLGIPVEEIVKATELTPEKSAFCHSALAAFIVKSQKEIHTPVRPEARSLGVVRQGFTTNGKLWEQL
jgi:hypothetical protein